MKRLAREWLWLVGSAPVAAVVIWWMEPPDPVSATLVGLALTVGLYAMIGLVRLTAWAIRTNRR